MRSWGRTASQENADEPDWTPQQWPEMPHRLTIICMGKPNMLLLDEPTNHLDIEAMSSLASAINGLVGGLVLVSHDFPLIDQVARKIWICEEGNVCPLEGRNP